jgi:hypothetical protein
MQPGKNTDDIHTILSRFNNWSGKQNGDAVQVVDDEVREIPYDEAMRRVRNRIRAGNQAAAKVKSEAVVAPVETAPPGPAVSGDGAAISAVAETTAPVREAVKPEGKAVKAVEALLQASMVEMAPVKRTAKKSGAKSAVKAKPRIAAATVRVAAAKAAPVRKGRAALKAPDAQPVEGKPEEFRQVLAKSVRQVDRAARSAKAVERKECVSVPLSSAEKVRLKQCAAIAGVTVAVYLRMRALGTEVPRNEARKERFEAQATREPVEQSVPVEESQPHSGFGDWITLLRNRFLSSPARFAERA